MGRTGRRQRKEFGQKMHWALRSCDRTIQVLRRINDMHELRSDGSCKCKQPKGCKIAELLNDRGLQELIRRVDDYEDRERERQRIIEDLLRRGDLDDFDDLVRDSGAYHRRHEGRDASSA